MVELLCTTRRAKTLQQTWLVGNPVALTQTAQFMVAATPPLPWMLDRAGSPYIKVDISEDADARDYVMSLGYLQAPVVVTSTGHWSGYRPDRLATAVAAAVA